MPTVVEVKHAAAKIGQAYLKQYYRPSHEIAVISKEQFKEILRSVCEAVDGRPPNTFEARVKQMLEDKKTETLGQH